MSPEKIAPKLEMSDARALVLSAGCLVLSAECLVPEEVGGWEVGEWGSWRVGELESWSSRVEFSDLS